MKLVVTIPAQNEEKTIAQVIRGIPARIEGINEIEVIVCNDGSDDHTAQYARDAGARVIDICGRPGLGTIFRTGFERAMRSGADIIVNIDGDGQFNPADIPRLIAPIIEDQADFVTASRFKDASLKPVMPPVKYHGNKIVTRIINWICGGTEFHDVSCGFRAFGREAAYRMTLFGRYTYTQETFIDLFGKGMRIVEVPLKIRGVREHGKSRVAGSIVKYATNSLPIILRAMRDIQPLKFFGGIGLILLLLGVTCGLVVTGFYTYSAVVLHKPKTEPVTSLITVGGVLIVLSFVLGVLALLADMMARHRKISEELLYLARRRIYSNKRTAKAALAPETHANGSPTLHDSWTLPVLRSIDQNGRRPEPEHAPAGR